MDRRGFLVSVVAALLFSGCVSLTPEQSAGLKEAQRFADEVTSAYGVHRVKVIGDSPWERGYASFFIQPDWWLDWPGIPDSTFNGYAVYWPGSEWIVIQRGALNQPSDARLALVKPLALATLQRLVPSGGSNPANVPQEWPGRYEDYRRGVEIMVKFLGMSPRQAVDYYANYLLAVSKSYDVTWMPGKPSRNRVDPDFWGYAPMYVPPPCSRLGVLWTQFEIADPIPPCVESSRR